MLQIGHPDLLYVFAGRSDAKLSRLAHHHPIAARLFGAIERGVGAGERTAGVVIFGHFCHAAGKGYPSK